MDLQRVDLNLLVSLDVLLAENNVTHAARRLSISQPALSAQLRQLRALFGDPLFVPAARGMTPTLRALEIQGPLRELLGAADRLVAGQRRFDPAVSDATFRIAATDSIHAAVCVPLIATMRKHAPGIRIALFPADRPRLDEQLASGELDLVLDTPHGLPANVKARLLYEETLLCLLRRDHPAARGALDLDTFCGLEHVLVSPSGGAFSGAVDEALALLGRERRVVASLTSFLVAPALVARSDLICTVPARLARNAGAAVALMPPPCAIRSFSIHMGWHARTDSDPARKWLRQQVLDSLGPATPDAGIAAQRTEGATRP